jgi:hypothetical protein
LEGGEKMSGLAVQSQSRVSEMIRRTAQFTIALLRASLTDWRSGLVTVFVPLLILSMFRILERPAPAGEVGRLNLNFHQ